MSLKVAGQVRAEMGRRKISQTDLAKALNMDASGVSRRVNGGISFKVEELEAVARELNARLVIELIPLDD